MEQSINYTQPRCRVGLMISHDAECEQGGMRVYERKENLQSAGRLADHNCTAAELRRRHGVADGSITKKTEIMEQSINTARNGVRHCEGLSNITDEETRELFTDSNGVLRSVVFVDSDTGETFFP